MTSIEEIYTSFQKLKKEEKRHLVNEMRSRGFAVRAIEPYTYSEVPVRHLFFYFDGESSPKNYFEVPEVYALFTQLLTEHKP